MLQHSSFTNLNCAALPLPPPPGFIFLHHPALGPLWDVIAQKIRGGALMEGSELLLEVAEARLVDVTVDGSLLVHADNVMGHQEPASLASSSSNGYSSWRGNGHRSSSSSSGRLSYSSHNGRLHMMNVCVENVGIDWHHPGNVYWQHRVQRHESCRVILRGRSEFEAYDCKIRGDQVGGCVCFLGGGLSAQHNPCRRVCGNECALLTCKQASSMRQHKHSRGSVPGWCV